MKINTIFKTAPLLVITACEIRVTSALAKGMGMGTAIKSKKSGNKKTKTKKSKKPSAPPFDVSASLLKCEVLYEDLLKKYDNPVIEEEEEEEEVNVYEYVIAAKYSGSAPVPGSASFCDWVPVAQLCLVLGAGFESERPLQLALSYYCREIHQAGCFAAPVLATLPRNSIQYSAEPLSSWHKHVYDAVIKAPSSSSETTVTMTKAEARECLDVEANCTDLAMIKKGWRKKSFELHPDRFIGQEDSEKAKLAPEQLHCVNIAYETLQSGNMNSMGGWYASLGGKQRTDFNGAMELVSIDQGKKSMEHPIELGGIKSAVVGLSPEVCMSFVARYTQQKR